MKYIFSLLLLLSYGISMNATVVATIERPDNQIVFYGEKAFGEAVAKAVDGDCITLSAGEFDACTINKRVLIKGVGLNPLTYSDADATVIRPGFELNIESDSQHSVSIEGITILGLVTLTKFSGTSFSKCHLGALDFGQSTYVDRPLSFIHCIIDDIEGSPYLKITAQNCVFSHFVSTNGSSFKITNSVVQYRSLTPLFSSSTLTNCILIQNNELEAALIYGTFRNCLWVYAGKAPNFSKAKVYTNKLYPKGETPFSDGRFYELNSKGLTYQGTDKKQLGIYGGSSPFDSRPAYTKGLKVSTGAITDSQSFLNIKIENL